VGTPKANEHIATHTAATCSAQTSALLRLSNWQAQAQSAAARNMRRADGDQLRTRALVLTVCWQCSSPWRGCVAPEFFRTVLGYPAVLAHSGRSLPKLSFPVSTHLQRARPTELSVAERSARNTRQTCQRQPRQPRQPREPRQPTPATPNASLTACRLLGQRANEPVCLPEAGSRLTPVYLLEVRTLCTNFEADLRVPTRG
jgi:hypothetical protein